MHRSYPCLLIAIFLAAVSSSGWKEVLSQEFERQEIGGVVFDLRAGLQLEKVADESLVRWPVVADWDREGRLVVVESGGASKPIVEHNKNQVHKIVRLIDENHDGVFDRRVLAADQLAFTEGVLCLGDSILAAAPPYIWKLTDHDGDGYCEQREVWFDGQTITGCANDLHGPYLGTDGWIYWCKGAFAKQTHELTDGSILQDRAAHIFRRRLEGGPIESVISGGMDNPVEVAFTPRGELFFTSTFLQYPRDGKRDGLGHAVYGSVFGKKHPAVEEVVCTGDLMPIMTHLGPAAPSGLTCLSPRATQRLCGTQADRPVLAAAQFNLHRVSVHELDGDGASYSTQDDVLLKTERIDFHPTDVLECSDGSLLVIDTGGWYELCCPSSRVDQKVAPGGIYRISSMHGHAIEQELVMDSGVSQVGAEQALQRMEDDRPWVRRAALLRLAELGDAAIPAWQTAMQNSVMDSLQSLQVLSSIGSERACELVLERLKNAATEETDVRSLACHILGLYRYQAAQAALESQVDDSDLRLVRKAVEALGRLGASSSVETLVSCAQRNPQDSILRHAVIYALIEIADQSKLQELLLAEQEGAKVIALRALSQLPNAQLQDTVFKLFAQAEEGELYQLALELLEKHPDWSEAGEDLFGQLAEKTSEGQAKRMDLLRVWRQQPSAIQYVAKELSAESLTEDNLAHLLKTWLGAELPAPLVRPVQHALQANPDLVLPLLTGIRWESDTSLPIVETMKQELETREKQDWDLAQVAQILTSLPDSVRVESDWLLDWSLANERYDLLLHLALEPQRARELLQQLKEHDVALPSFVRLINKVGSDPLDDEMLRNLRSLPAAKRLPDQFLVNLYLGRSEHLRELASQVEQELHRQPHDVTQAVASKLEQLPQGHVLEGMQVFRSAKAGCSNCHRVGYVGGSIGPELTRIGATRTKEALLEAILFPSARIEQSYRSVKVLTREGQVLTGLPIEQSDELHLQISADEQVIIESDRVVQVQPSDVSVMPRGIEEILTEQQLADVLAFLQAAK